MRIRPYVSSERLRRSALGAALAMLSNAALAQAPILNPGPPGTPPRRLDADEAIALARTAYTRADVEFLRAMIPHHQQAIDMAALAKDRTNKREILDAAGRIDSSQKDEIKFMREWLEERGELAAAAMDHAAHGAGAHAAGAEHGATDRGAAAHADTDHGAHAALGITMKGMATPEQMAALAAASGTDFDRMFLELMIKHHEGAVEMVDALTDLPGSAHEPTLFEFTREVTNDQNAEIERMSKLLASLSPDPRVNLKPGFSDAGEAIQNLTKVASLPKPAGFFDPDNPASLSPRRLAALNQAGDRRSQRRGRNETGRGRGGGNRGTLLSFSNTDMAFRDDIMVVGNYHGFNVYRLDASGTPQLLSSVVCPGGQGDVSIVGDLVIMSVEQMRGRVDCGLDGAPVDASPERFRGMRIFDISDVSRPTQVGQVQTCRGSHTHSVVASDDERIVVYNSGTAGVRDEDELPGCVGAIAGDTRTALFRVDVIEIPVRDPSRARIIDSPTVFADEETGVIAGLWRGGDHGENTQETNQTNHCHDITVFPTANVAAGACSGNGILFDISDPLAPKRIDAVVDEGFAYWHSATFNNDGTKVIFTDEWGGGGRPRCRAHDPLDWGADAVYDIVDGKLVYRSHFKMPAPQTEQENCVAHNGSIVPVPGRDIMVQSWYQGGISVWDFTDSTNPFEIAFFDRGPVDAEELTTGGYWSSYWYDGRIYATEIARGVDVFELAPSEHLTANEIAAAALADQGRLFNPQQQYPVTWPAEPVVARAYVDQLRRGGDVAAATLDELDAALGLVEQRLAASGRDAALSARLTALAARLDQGSGAAITQKRTRALAETLSGLAARLGATG